MSEGHAVFAMCTPDSSDHECRFFPVVEGLVVPDQIAAALLGLIISFSRPAELTLPVAPASEDPVGSFSDQRDPASNRPRQSWSGRIEGRVVHGGKGISSRVTLQVFQRFPGRPLRRSRADSTGAFSFDGVPAGRHQICLYR